MTGASPWWRGAVIYQVYIRSFADGNGDGQGDFAGLISKLGYLAGLGVDALWLSPIHPSPNRDWGYDVSDYEGVHPDYGTRRRFRGPAGRGTSAGPQGHARRGAGPYLRRASLVPRQPEGRGQGRLVCLGRSQAGRHGPEQLAVGLRGARPGPISRRGGSTTTTNSCASSPSSTGASRRPGRRRWRCSTTGWRAGWMASGSMSRMPISTTPSLTDNPPVPMEARTAHHWAHAPNLQFHYHDSNLAENIEALDEIRRVVDRYPDRFVMGEFSEEAARCGCYAAPDAGLHSGYSFPLLEARTLGPDFIREHYAMLSAHPDHWPSVAFSNHDVMRTVSRFGGKEPASELASLMLALLLSLRGTALLYQGEELGLPQAPIRRDQLTRSRGRPLLSLHLRAGRLPHAHALGCRRGQSGLHDRRAVAARWPRRIASWRSRANSSSRHRRSTLPGASSRPARQVAALRLGEIDFIDAPEPVLAFVRSQGEERILCLFNMSGEEVVLRAIARIAAGCQPRHRLRNSSA